MTNAETRAVFGLAGVFGLRMLGLFMVLPVMSVYAAGLPGQTPVLIGLALGVYGLTQALFQIPFGIWSDRWGRKPVISIGLLIFALGSVVAATGEHVLTVILGRGLQGAGAIAAAVMALTADLTREEQRTKAMAVIGVSVGASFMTALILAPVLQPLIGVPGIFWLTAVLALAALLVLWFGIPNPARSTSHRDVQAVPRQLLSICRDPALLRLNLGIFVLHSMLTAMFVVIPLTLSGGLEMPLAEHWKLYAPVVLVSAVATIPLVMLSARSRWIPRIMMLAIVNLLASQGLLLVGHGHMIELVVGLCVFFWGFNTLEALLPSLVSRLAPAAGKGTAIGVYNGFQFLGVFLGGVAGGLLFEAHGASGVFVFCGVLAGLWLIVVGSAPAPRLLASRMLRIPALSPATARELAMIQGVHEAVIVPEEGVAYLKVDEQDLDERDLRRFSAD